MTTQSTPTHNFPPTILPYDKASAIKLDTMQLSQLLANNGELPQPALKKNGSHVKRKTDEELLADANSELKLSGESEQEQPLQLAQAETTDAASATAASASTTTTASWAGGIDAILGSAGVGTGTAIAGAAAGGLVVGIVASGNNDASASATGTAANMNDAPILVNNTLQILTPVNGAIHNITSANFSATDADVNADGVTPTDTLTFTVSGVTGGVFRLNGLTDTTSFTEAQIAANAVTFVVAGTQLPTFSTSVSDGIVTTAPSPAASNGPWLVSTTPVDNSNSFANGGSIVLTFNKAVQMGSGNIVITGGTDVRIIPVTDVSQVTFLGNTVTINPPLDLLSDRTYFVTIESGVITDTAVGTPNAFKGITDITTLNFFTGPAPILVSATPADNTTAVPVGNNIVLTFSENVVAGVGDIVITNANNPADTRTVTVGPNNTVTTTVNDVVVIIDLDGTGEVRFSGNTVTINPATDLVENGIYNVQMASGVIKDTAGNPYAGISNATTLNFNTTSTAAPTLVSSSPLDNGLNVSVSGNIVLTFSDAVIAGTGNIVITNVNSPADTRTITVGGVDPDGTVTFSGNTVTINPAANLANGASYNVQIASTTIKSTSGLAFAGIANATTLNFTITTNLPPTVTDAHINMTSTGAGVLAGETAGQVYIVGDTITATWNNLGAGGDGNNDIASVMMDFSEFNSGTPALVNATLNAGIWTASYVVSNITANSVNNRNVAVIATDTVGNITTLRDAANLSVQDTTAPTVTINTIMGDNQLNFLEATTANQLPQPNVQNPGNAGLAWSISGTASVDVAGQTVTIIINDGAHPAIEGTAIVQADGSWKVLADTGTGLSNSLFDIQFLNPGSMTVVASIFDGAGNVGESNPAIIIMDIATPSVMGGSFTTGANASVTLNFTELMGTPTIAGLTILKNGTEAVTTGILFGGTTTNLTIATMASLATTDFVKVNYVDATGNWGDAAGNQVPDSQWFIGGSGNNTINVHAINGSVTVPVAATIFGNAGNDIIIGSNTTADINLLTNPFGDVIFGGAGNDTITGGAGGDILSGGLGGADNFIFNRGDAVAIVARGNAQDFLFAAFDPNGVDPLVERIVDLDTQDTITLNGNLRQANQNEFNTSAGLTADDTFALVRGDYVRGVFFKVGSELNISNPDHIGDDMMLFYDNSTAAGVQLAGVLLDGAGGMAFNINTFGGVNTITIA